MFKALTTGLQFTSESRLGRPLGTYDHPHPKRAENWRSNRSARNVALSLRSLQQLSSHLSAIDTQPNTNLVASFDKALLKQSVDTIRDLVRDTLGPVLGVSAGFNALDGD
jgi:predicted lipoprotein